MPLERWSDVEAITAAKQRLIARMPGWRAPVAYGVALVGSGSSSAQFPVVNVPVHELPALVLGLVTGRRSGSGTFDLAPSELAAALALLQPAEAATMYNHPNLWSWRRLAVEWDADPAARLVAVFVADHADDPSSPFDEALRHQIRSGQRTAAVFVEGVSSTAVDNSAPSTD